MFANICCSDGAEGFAGGPAVSLREKLDLLVLEYEPEITFLNITKRKILDVCQSHHAENAFVKVHFGCSLSKEKDLTLYCHGKGFRCVKPGFLIPA